MKIYIKTEIKKSKIGNEKELDKSVKLLEKLTFAVWKLYPKAQATDSKAYPDGTAVTFEIA